MRQTWGKSRKKEIWQFLHNFDEKIQKRVSKLSIRQFEPLLLLYVNASQLSRSSANVYDPRHLSKNENDTFY